MALLILMDHLLDLVPVVSLRFEATSDGSINKFSIYDFANPRQIFTIRFDVRFSGTSTGNFSLYIGSDISSNGVYNGTGGDGRCSWHRCVCRLGLDLLIQ